MCWSPNGVYLTVLTEQGGVELWTSTGDSATVAHSFDTAVLFSYIKWHSVVAEDGGMLLARYVSHLQGGLQDPGQGGLQYWDPPVDPRMHSKL